MISPAVNSPALGYLECDGPPSLLLVWFWAMRFEYVMLKKTAALLDMTAR